MTVTDSPSKLRIDIKKGQNEASCNRFNRFATIHSQDGDNHRATMCETCCDRSLNSTASQRQPALLQANGSWQPQLPSPGAASPPHQRSPAALQAYDSWQPQLPSPCQPAVSSPHHRSTKVSHQNHSPSPCAPRAAAVPRGANTSQRSAHRSPGSRPCGGFKVATVPNAPVNCPSTCPGALPIVLNAVTNNRPEEAVARVMPLERPAPNISATLDSQFLEGLGTSDYQENGLFSVTDVPNPGFYGGTYIVENDNNATYDVPSGLESSNIYAHEHHHHYQDLPGALDQYIQTAADNYGQHQNQQLLNETQPCGMLGASFHSRNKVEFLDNMTAPSWIYEDSMHGLDTTPPTGLFEGSYAFDDFSTPHSRGYQNATSMFDMTAPSGDFGGSYQSESNHARRRLTFEMSPVNPLHLSSLDASLLEGVRCDRSCPAANRGENRWRHVQVSVTAPVPAALADSSNFLNSINDSSHQLR